MTIKSLLQPFISRVITSRRLRQFKRFIFSLRKSINPSLDTVTLYLRVNDPYCYLLLQVLPGFLSSNQKLLDVEIILNLDTNLNVEAKKQAHYSLKDVKRLAKQAQLVFPYNAKLPNDKNTWLATAILLENKNHPHFLNLCHEISRLLWASGDQEIINNNLTVCAKQYGQIDKVLGKHLLILAEEKLLQHGHYQSGMLYYGGEWYWALDRLWHLQRRLLNNAKDKQAVPVYLRRNRELISPQILKRIENKPELPVMDFYFSFRSPYSYIAAQRLFELSQKLTLNINIKPILPMVSRGLQVPKMKRLYILHDANREANRYQIPFGKIVDPLGVGVTNCLALFYFAKQHSKTLPFVASISRGIWAEGADTTSPKVLSTLVTRAGLDWLEAKHWLANDHWKTHAEKNRTDLEKIGLWGVPSFHFNGLSIWGQDRLSMMVNELLSEQISTQLNAKS